MRMDECVGQCGAYNRESLTGNVCQKYLSIVCDCPSRAFEWPPLETHRPAPSLARVDTCGGDNYVSFIPAIEGSLMSRDHL